MTEEKIYDINERLSRIEGKLQEIEKKIDSLEDFMISPKDLLKYMTYIVIIVLSFASAVLGINWMFKLPVG